MREPSFDDAELKPQARQSVRRTGPSQCNTAPYLPSGCDIEEALLKVTGPFTLYLQENGRYLGGATIKDISRLTIEGRGAIITAVAGGRGLTFIGCEGLVVKNLTCDGGDVGVKLQGCNNAKLHGVTAKNTASFGILGTTRTAPIKNKKLPPGVTKLVLCSCITVNTTDAGIHTANVSHVTVQLCSCSGSTTSHGLYLGQSGDNLTVTGGFFNGNQDNGIQVNPEEGKHWMVRAKKPFRDTKSKVVKITGARLTGNNHGMNLLGVQGTATNPVLVSGNFVLETKDKSGILLGRVRAPQQPKTPALNVRLEQNTFSFAPPAATNSAIREESGNQVQGTQYDGLGNVTDNGRVYCKEGHSNPALRC